MHTALYAGRSPLSTTKQVTKQIRPFRHQVHKRIAAFKSSRA